MVMCVKKELKQGDMIEWLGKKEVNNAWLL
jgi:hypothetical protein